MLREGWFMCFEEGREQGAGSTEQRAQSKEQEYNIIKRFRRGNTFLTN